MVKGPKIKDIEGFVGYRVDEKSNVYSLRQQWLLGESAGQLSTRIDRAGYRSVRLSRNGQTYTKLLHRLLGQVFIPNPLNLPELNHLDGDKLNNELWNLQWTSHSLNIQHAYNHGLIKKRTRRVIDKSNGMLFNSAYDAAKHYGLPYPTVKGYLSGQRNNPTTLQYCDNNQ